MTYGLAGHLSVGSVGEPASPSWLGPTGFGRGNVQERRGPAAQRLPGLLALWGGNVRIRVISACGRLHETREWCVLLCLSLSLDPRLLVAEDGESARLAGAMGTRAGSRSE